MGITLKLLVGSTGHGPGLAIDHIIDKKRRLYSIHLFIEVFVGERETAVGWVLIASIY